MKVALTESGPFVDLETFESVTRSYSARLRADIACLTSVRKLAQLLPIANASQRLEAATMLARLVGDAIKKAEEDLEALAIGQAKVDQSKAAALAVVSAPAGRPN